MNKGLVRSTLKEFMDTNCMRAHLVLPVFDASAAALAHVRNEITELLFAERTDKKISFSMLRSLNVSEQKFIESL
jgi:hypothetical protein